jgi:hypothetical protein
MHAAQADKKSKQSKAIKTLLKINKTRAVSMSIKNSPQKNIQNNHEIVILKL